ncbi:DNA repair protein Sae2/CtIP [Penicillium cosmopolitanum]|uniref:DNA repair protein Sae2/CtIP n=1 Tax=Penicillium cosmopolitanum TaxID=1131564 RepID=A0A9W9WBG6_9EURO|nr:DNA repair protein Sae2/CtIP [Penicillium cosmopolitanum]KAJ5414444.1 DNA repair protein Sae2/CtIP [Penicillium cosmopolitanum]
MEVLRELHASITEACEASFSIAYRNLESQNANLQKRTEEAERNAATASAAQQATENRNQELQSHVAALQEQLRHFESRPEDLELPNQLSHLEDEFAPEHVLATINHDNVDQLKKTLMKKYSALYANLQTLSQGWGSLKAKVLQHKKKLRHWDKQLERNEFTLILNGSPVTFRRTQISKEGTTNTHIPAGTANSVSNESLMNRATSISSTSTTTNPPNNQTRGPLTDTRVHVKTEEQSQPIDLGEHPEEVQSQPGVDSIPSEANSDTLPLLPDMKNLKRKRVVSSTNSSKPRETIPSRSGVVKNEPISSSPPRNSIHSIGQHFPSTQDLDAIGHTVQTPTKRRSRRKASGQGHQGHEDEYSPVNPLLKMPDDRSFQTPSILNPVDGNSRIGGQSNRESGSKKQKVRSQRATVVKTEVCDSEEDCDDQAQDSEQASKSTSAAQPNANSHEISEPSHADLPQVSHGAAATSSANRNIAESSKRQPPTPMATDETESQSQPYPQVRPEDEPYRSLPLHRLNLSHFKINPDGNQGMDYAYSTVVRKKDDRKCLSGCTRPGCCGDRFRAMARLGGLPTNNQEQENQRILEEYLGEERHRLEGLSSEDRERLLIEAKARAIANQYGKHRHTHQRARTPPGFWRTEMPDTQELEADWAAAGNLERDKIEERYREAMRPGGLWTWADE